MLLYLLISTCVHVNVICELQSYLIGKELLFGIIYMKLVLTCFEIILIYHLISYSHLHSSFCITMFRKFMIKSNVCWISQHKWLAIWRSLGDGKKQSGFPWFLIICSISKDKYTAQHLALNHPTDLEDGWRWLDCKCWIICIFETLLLVCYLPHKLQND